MKSAKQKSKSKKSQPEPEPEESPPTSESKPSANREKLRARAIGLVARAAHEGTPEEEARTSAFVAAKIIHTEKLLEVAPGRHALLERLDALDDDVLNALGLVIEEALEGDGMAKAGQATRWRNEAKHLQRKLDTFAGALRLILQGHKLGVAERQTLSCGFCGGPLLLGDIIVWKRRRSDSVHYSCCVHALQHHGQIPS